MVLTLADLDRIENRADRMDGAAIIYDEQMALIDLARRAIVQRDRYTPVERYDKETRSWVSLEN